MFLLKKLVTALILPPFSLILLALAGIFLTRRLPRTGRWLATLSLAALFALSLPIVSVALQRSLEKYPPLPPEALGKTEAIVILAGGIYRNAPEYGTDTVNRYSLERIRYGVKLQKQSGLPILVTGGALSGDISEAQAMREVIEQELGGTVRWLEDKSRDTSENAHYSAPILKAAGITRITLVSHAWHFQRAVPLFEQYGLQVTPAPTIFFSISELGVSHFLPSGSAFAFSSIALHEWLGFIAQQYRRQANTVTSVPPA